MYLEMTEHGGSFETALTNYCQLVSYLHVPFDTANFTAFAKANGSG